MFDCRGRFHPSLLFVAPAKQCRSRLRFQSQTVGDVSQIQACQIAEITARKVLFRFVQSRHSTSRLDPRPSHNWSDVLQSTVAFGRAQSRDHGAHPGNLLAAATLVQPPPTAAATPSGLTVATTNNRRWSVAAQSIASGHGSNTGQAAPTPTTETIPATTMTKCRRYKTFFSSSLRRPSLNKLDRLSLTSIFNI